MNERVIEIIMWEQEIVLVFSSEVYARRAMYKILKSNPDLPVSLQEWADPRDGLADIRDREAAGWVIAEYRRHGY